MKTESSTNSPTATPAPTKEPTRPSRTSSHLDFFSPTNWRPQDLGLSDALVLSEQA